MMTYTHVLSHLIQVLTRFPLIAAENHRPVTTNENSKRKCESPRRPISRVCVLISTRKKHLFTNSRYESDMAHHIFRLPNVIYTISHIRLYIIHRSYFVLCVFAQSINCHCIAVDPSRTNITSLVLAAIKTYVPFIFSAFIRAISHLFRVLVLFGARAEN